MTRVASLKLCIGDALYLKITCILKLRLLSNHRYYDLNEIWYNPRKFNSSPFDPTHARIVVVLVLPFSKGAHWTFEGQVKHIQEGDLYTISVGGVKKCENFQPYTSETAERYVFFMNVVPTMIIVTKT